MQGETFPCCVACLARKRFPDAQPLQIPHKDVAGDFSLHGLTILTMPLAGLLARSDWKGRAQHRHQLGRAALF
jgi:hypothetical protein